MNDTSWCHDCGGEFQPGVTTCPDCGVQLSTDAPSGGPVGADGPATPASASPGARALRWGAVLALAFWVASVVLTVWAMWEATSDTPSLQTTQSLQGIGVYPQPPDASWLARPRAVLLAAVQTTSPYLLVAVVAFGLSLLVDGRRAVPSTGHLDDEPAGLRRLMTAGGAASLLTWIGLGALALFVVHGVHTAWTVWDNLGARQTTSAVGALASPGLDTEISLWLQIRLTVLLTLEVTGIWLLVGVVSYGLGALVRRSEVL